MRMTRFLSSLFRVLSMASGLSAFVLAAKFRSDASSALADGAWIGPILLAYCFATLGKSLYAKAIRMEMERDRRSPVLFLRSFEEEKDARTALISLSVTRFLRAVFWNVEDRAVRTFREYGPVTMLNSPKRWLPGPGANMPEVGNENWPEEVWLLMRDAVLVLIAAGRTPGLLWEIGTALTISNRRKVLIIVRNGLEYELVRERLQSALGDRGKLRPWPHSPRFNRIYFMYLNEDDEVRSVTPSFWLRVRDFAQATNFVWSPKRWSTVGRCVPGFFLQNGLIPPEEAGSSKGRKHGPPRA
jgi:hypothetical protein